MRKIIFLACLYFYFTPFELYAYNPYNCSTPICEIAFDEAPTFTFDKTDGRLYFKIATNIDYGALSTYVNNCVVEYHYPGTSTYTKIIEIDDNSLGSGTGYGSQYWSETGRTTYTHRYTGASWVSGDGKTRSSATTCTLDNRQWLGQHVKFTLPSGEIPNTIYLHYSSSFGGESCSSQDISWNLDITPVKNPVNLQATTDNCSFVKLTWQEPSTIEYTLYRNYSIYRDGVYLATVNSSTFSYDDMSANSNGSNHTYTVKTKIDYG